MGAACSDYEESGGGRGSRVVVGFARLTQQQQSYQQDETMR